MGGREWYGSQLLLTAADEEQAEEGGQQDELVPLVCHFGSREGQVAPERGCGSGRDPGRFANVPDRSDEVVQRTISINSLRKGRACKSYKSQGPQYTSMRHQTCVLHPPCTCHARRLQWGDAWGGRWADEETMSSQAVERGLAQVEQQWLRHLECA